MNFEEIKSTFLKYPIPESKPYYPFGNELRAITITNYCQPFTEISEKQKFYYSNFILDELTLQDVSNEIGVPMEFLHQYNKKMETYYSIPSLRSYKANVLKEYYGSQLFSQINPLKVKKEYGKVTKEMMISTIIELKKQMKDDYEIPDMFKGMVRMFAEENDDIFIFEELKQLEEGKKTLIHDEIDLMVLFVMLWKKNTAEKIGQQCIDHSLGSELIELYLSTPMNGSKRNAQIVFMTLQTLLALMFYTKDQCGMTEKHLTMFIEEIVKQTRLLPVEINNFAFCIIRLLMEMNEVVFQTMDQIPIENLATISNICPASICVLNQLHMKETYKQFTVQTMTPNQMIFQSLYCLKNKGRYTYSGIPLKIMKEIEEYSIFPNTYEDERLYGLASMMYSLSTETFDNVTEVLTKLRDFLLPEITTEQGYYGHTSSTSVEAIKGTFCPLARERLFNAFENLHKLVKSKIEIQLTIDRMEKLLFKTKPDYYFPATSRNKMTGMYDKQGPIGVTCLFASELLTKLVLKENDMNRENLNVVREYLYGYGVSASLPGSSYYQQKSGLKDMYSTVKTFLATALPKRVSIIEYENDRIIVPNEIQEPVCLMIKKYTKDYSSQCSFDMSFMNEQNEKYVFASGLFALKDNEEKFLLIRKTNEEYYQVEYRTEKSSTAHHEKEMEYHNIEVTNNEMLVFSTGMKGSNRDSTNELRPVMLVYEKQSEQSKHQYRSIDKIAAKSSSMMKTEISKLSLKHQYYVDFQTMLHYTKFSFMKNTQEIDILPMESFSLLVDTTFQKYEKQKVVQFIFLSVYELIRRTNDIFKNDDFLMYLQMIFDLFNKPLIRKMVCQMITLDSKLIGHLFDHDKPGIAYFMTKLMVEMSHSTDQQEIIIFISFLKHVASFSPQSMTLHSYKAFNPTMNTLLLMNPKCYEYIRKTELLSFALNCLREKKYDINNTGLLKMWLMSDVVEYQVTNSVEEELEKMQFEETEVSLFVKKIDEVVEGQTLDVEFVSKIIKEVMKDNFDISNEIMKTILRKINISDNSNYFPMLQLLLSLDDSYQDERIRFAKEQIDFTKIKTTNLETVGPFMLQMMRQFNYDTYMNDSYCATILKINEQAKKKIVYTNDLSKILKQYTTDQLIEMKHQGMLKQYHSWEMDLYVETLELINIEKKKDNNYFVMMNYGVNKLQLTYMKALLTHCKGCSDTVITKPIESVSPSTSLSSSTLSSLMEESSDDYAEDNDILDKIH